MGSPNSTGNTDKKSPQSIGHQLVVEIIQMSPRWAWQQDRQAQEERSFFEKRRTKKFLFSAVYFTRGLATA